MSMSSNGGGGLGGMVPDAASKHKQLSELLRAGSSSSLGPSLGSSSPQPGMGVQLGALGKSPLGQASPSHPSQAQKQAPAAPPGSQGNGGLGLTAFNQAMMNSGQSHGVLGQGAQPPQGALMNGSLGGAGRGRATPGLQYQGPVGGGAGVSGAGSALAETLTQGAPQMGVHSTINAQPAGNMNKVGPADGFGWQREIVCD